MNITINRSELSDAVSRATVITPETSPIKELEGVLLETDAAANSLTVTATNMEVALEQRLACDTAEDDAMVVNVDLFNAMLKKLTGETVTLHRRSDDPVLTIESGEAMYCLPALKRGNFPHTEIAFPDDTIPVTGVPSLVRRSTFAVLAKNSDPLLKCVNLRFTRDGINAVGSDGLRLVSTKGDKSSTGDVSLLVPATSLNVLARICTDQDAFRVGTTGKSIVFSKPGMTYTARIMEAEYVDTDRIIGSLKNTFTVLTDIAELWSALRYVSAADPGGRVRLRFDGLKLSFFAIGEFGKASKTIEVTPLTGAPSGEYWQATGKLDDCLHALSGTATLGVAQNGLPTLSTEESFYFQPSVRPPQPKAAPKQEPAESSAPEAKAKAEPKKRRAKKAA